MSIQKFKQLCKRNGLCDEYSEKWDNCTNPQQLIQLATTTEGAAFLCDAYAFGWMMVSTEGMKNTFAEYINENQPIEQKGYNSAMFCGVSDTKIMATSTLLLILDSKCEVIVPKNHVCRIYTACSDVRIASYGMCEVEAFFDTESDKQAKVEVMGNVSVTQHNESKWRNKQ